MNPTASCPTTGEIGGPDGADPRARIKETRIEVDALLPEGPYDLWRGGETTLLRVDFSCGLAGGQAEQGGREGHTRRGAGPRLRQEAA